MISEKLENLVRIGQLKKEPPRVDELAGLKRSGLARLKDAERGDLSFESRFELAFAYELNQGLKHILTIIPCDSPWSSGSTRSLESSGHELSTQLRGNY